MMEKMVEEPPPMVVLVHGPPGVSMAYMGFDGCCIILYLNPSQLLEIRWPERIYKTPLFHPRWGRAR